MKPVGDLVLPCNTFRMLVDFEVNQSNVKVTVTVNMLIYRPNLNWIITRHRIDPS